MNHLRLETLGQLAATLGLVVSCGGDVHNLGTDTGGSSGVATGGGSAVATGGSGIGEIGGNTGTQGTVTPYITDPTLPIDPTCTCASSDKICNAARECVPRCDDAGRCARWLANHAVKDLFVEGTSLYYLVAATTDPLGNPDANGALYRVETTGGTPTLIAGSLGNPYKILGRYKNATILQSQDTNGIRPIISVSDAGVASTLGQQAGYAGAMWGNWIAYPDPDELKIMGIDLDGTLEPVVLAQATLPALRVSMPIVLDDTILYGSYVDQNNFQLCSLPISQLASEPTCLPVDTYNGCVYAAASSGNQFYCWSISGGLSSFVPPSTSMKLLYVEHDPMGQSSTVYANGGLYINDVWLDSGLVGHALLVRVPTTVGRLPQEIVPDSLLSRHCSMGASGVAGVPFGVGSSDIFWVQYVPTSDNNQPQYIFSAPLPPQPCDADLPCADSTLTCTNGFCGPA